jgi:hypothetical protein
MAPSSLDPVGKRKRAAAESGERAAKVARSSGSGGAPQGAIQLDNKVGTLRGRKVRRRPLCSKGGAATLRLCSAQHALCITAARHMGCSSSAGAGSSAASCLCCLQGLKWVSVSAFKGQQRVDLRNFFRVSIKTEEYV